MRRICSMCLLVTVWALPAAAAVPKQKVIAFPCFKNLADGRVLVDGTEWDEKMRELGYDLADGAYVPWKVLKFTKKKVRDETWADGTCRMQLLPVAK